MMKKLKEFQNPFWKIYVVYAGGVFTLRPTRDITGAPVENGKSVMVRSDDGKRMVALLEVLDASDAEAGRAHQKILTFEEMVRDIRDGYVKYLWVKKENWLKFAQRYGRRYGLKDGEKEL